APPAAAERHLAARRPAYCAGGARSVRLRAAVHARAADGRATLIANSPRGHPIVDCRLSILICNLQSRHGSKILYVWWWGGGGGYPAPTLGEAWRGHPEGTRAPPNLPKCQVDRVRIEPCPTICNYPA